MRSAIESSSTVNWLLGVDVKQVLSTAVIVISIYLSAGTAYILGVVLSLPPAIISLFNHATFVYLLGNLTFMAVLLVILVKISRQIVLANFFFFNFLIVKFKVASKRKGGILHPSVTRLKSRLDKAIIEGKSFRIGVLSIQIALALLCWAPMFFAIPREGWVTTPWSAMFYTTFVFLGFIAIVGTLSAFRVGMQKNTMNFFSTTDGRRLVIWTALFVLVLIGMLRSLTMMWGWTVNHHSADASCALAPMMPLQAGDLYFDQQSSNFVVISSGRVLFSVPHMELGKVPACI
jgi:hypothetical protein